MEAPEWIWETLEIDATQEERAIKRAYAAKLKRTRPEENPQEFQRLREAYEAALAWLISQPTANDTDAADAADAANAAKTPSTIKQNAPPEAENTPSLLISAPDVSPPWLQEAPHTVAEKCWIAFMGNARNPTTLANILQSEALCSLAARDAFELRAAAYCASDEHERDLASLLIETFQWNINIIHLQKISPQLAKSVMGRYYAHKEFDALSDQAVHLPTLKYLLSQRLPKRFLQLHLADQGFTRSMQSWLYSLHWRFPDVVQYKLNPEVVNTWSNLIDAKRYFLQTALASFFVGLPVSALFMAGYALFDQSDTSFGDRKLMIPFFLAGEMCSFAAIAWLSFSPESRITRWLVHVRDGVLHNPIQVYRFEMRVHFGLIWLFGLVSLSFLLPKHAWQTEQSMMMLISFLLLIYIASADLEWYKLVVGVALGLVLAVALHEPEQHSFNLSSCMMFFSGLVFLIQRGSGPWLCWAGYQQLNYSRAVWLALALIWIIANLVYTEWQQDATMSISGALLFLFGLQICSFYVRSLNLTITLVRAHFIGLITLNLSNQTFTGSPQFIFACMVFYTLLAICNIVEDRDLFTRKT